MEVYAGAGRSKTLGVELGDGGDAVSVVLICGGKSKIQNSRDIGRSMLRRYEERLRPERIDVR
jgi:hypothetical protein